jgi:hypothetical protein
MLQDMPANLSWTVVPTLTAATPEQSGQLAQVCLTATSQADTYCRTPLRATLVTETFQGPGMPRLSVSRDTGIASLITRQQPVLSVAAVQVSPSRSFPEQWTLVPSAQARVRKPVLMAAAGIPVTRPSGGNVIDLAPGNIITGNGRGYQTVLCSYVSGYPHAGLTADAEAGATTLEVDDVTGWAGWTGFAWDGPAGEMVTVESVSATTPVQLPGVAGTAQAGPGTLTLSLPLTQNHGAGAVLSAIPAGALHGVALMAAVQALETIDAIATQSLSGALAGGTGVLAEQAEMALDDFRAWG